MIFFKKEPEPSGLCPWVHFLDAEPKARFPFLWPLATYSESQSLQNLNILMLIHCLIFWNVIRVNNSFQVKNKSAWLSLWNTTYPLSSVYETRATTIARLTFRFRIISVNPCLVTFGDAFHEVLIRFCFLMEISGDRRTVLDCEDTRNEFRRIASHVQILRQNGLACTSICQPLQKFHALLIAYLQALIIAQVPQNHHLCLLTVARIADCHIYAYWQSPG